jgi:hypothetical protein
MSVELAVETVKKPLYLVMVGAFYILYATAFLGIMYVNPKYIANLDLAIQTFVCVFLIYKFHPFRQHKLEPFDSNIIFASALLLLANMGLSEYVLSTIRSKGEQLVQYKPTPNILSM